MSPNKGERSTLDPQASNLNSILHSQTSAMNQNIKISSVLKQSLAHPPRPIDYALTTQRLTRSPPPLTLDQTLNPMPYLSLKPLALSPEALSSQF